MTGRAIGNFGTARHLARGSCAMDLGVRATARMDRHVRGSVVMVLRDSRASARKVRPVRASVETDRLVMATVGMALLVRAIAVMARRVSRATGGARCGLTVRPAAGWGTGLARRARSADRWRRSGRRG